MRIEDIVVLIAVIVIVDVAILVALLRKQRARKASSDTTTIATELGTTADLPKKSPAPVDVRYNPDDPHDATIDTYWQVWFLPTLLAIISAPFLLVGAGFGIASRAGRRRGPEIL